MGLDPISWAIIGAGAQVANFRKQEKAAKNAAADQAKAQQAELDKIKSLDDEQKKINIRDEAKKQQQQAAASAMGRRSTILTSPLGVSGETTTGRKTLLGS